MIYQKRGGWFWRSADGQLHKFKSEAAALAASGITKGVDPFVVEGPVEVELDIKDFELDSDSDSDSDDMNDISMFNG